MAEETLIHLNKWCFRQKPSSAPFRDGAACGYGSAHALIVQWVSRVTCPQCIELIPDVWKKYVEVLK